MIKRVLSSAVEKLYWRCHDSNAYRLRKKAEKGDFSYSLFERLNRSWLKEAGIRTVIDAGASRGDWSKAAHEAFPEAAIYAFEPIPEEFKKLKERLRNFQRFYAFETALGDKEETALFYLNEFSPSSSLLRMRPAHKRHFNFTEKEKEIQVPVTTLDKALSGRDLEENILIKMDVQGNELKAIHGARSILLRAKIAIFEASFEALYEGEPLFDGIYEAMRAMGFKYCGSLGQLLSPLDGRPLQEDGVYLKN